MQASCLPSDDVVKASFRVVYRWIMYNATGNPCYAAEAWLICREVKAAPPPWVLEAVDIAARRGHFFTRRGQGRGSSGDVRRRAADNREVQVIIGNAVEIYEREPGLCQNDLADRVGIDRGQFARILNKWEKALGPYAWRRKDAEARTLSMNRPRPAIKYISSQGAPEGKE